MDSPPPRIPRRHSRPPAKQAMPAVPAREPRTPPRASVAQPVRSASASPWALLAHLVRPHGRQGEIICDILTDFPERFHQRQRVFLIPPARIGTSPREVLIENFWFLRSRLVVKIQGIDSINDAEPLRGYDVAIPAAERAPLDEGSVYVSDLVGCHVFDLSFGTDVGEVIDVDRGSSSTDLLVVRRPGLRAPASEALIPFVRDYLVRIDTAARRIEMRLPEGLLDINAPLTDEEKREQNQHS